MSLPISTVTNFIFNTTSTDFGAFVRCSLSYEQPEKLNSPTESFEAVPYCTAANKETTVYGNNENFRIPSVHRQCRIVVIESFEKQVDFFVNLEDLNVLAPGLVNELGTIRSYQDGPSYGIGEIGVGMTEFEMMLTLISNCIGENERKEILGQNMFRMLILARRFRIKSLAEECRQHVLKADYSKLSYESVRSWFDAFNKTGLDDKNKTIFHLLSSKLMLRLGNGARKIKRETVVDNFQTNRKPNYTYAQDALIQFYKTNPVTLRK